MNFIERYLGFLPDGGSIEVSFGTAVLIQPLMSKRDFHENFGQPFAPRTKSNGLLRSGPVPWLRNNGVNAVTALDSVSPTMT